jgi:hypothetical protein
MSRAVRLAGLGLVLLVGCVPLETLHPESDLAQVPTSPFPPSVTQLVKRAKLSFAPANEDICWRVDAVGRKLLQANPQVGLQPRFGTIGAKEPEIFHADLYVVYVTEGLVRQCRTEAELAAVLASELGKMVSEREAATSRDTRLPEPSPPIHLPIGSPGNPVAADPTYFVEIAKFEKEHPKSGRKKALPAPDPRKVAVAILENAGFQPADLTSAASILQSADRNCTLERQFKGIVGPDGTAWRPQQ